MASKNLSIERVAIVEKKSYPELEMIEKNFQVSDQGELCLAIGGDGTFILAAHKFNCPILPIRSEEKDSLGYRADVSLSQIKDIVADLKKGRYLIERYPKLRISYLNQTYDAVNDAVLLRAEPKALHFAVTYYDDRGDEVPLYPGEVRGDGVIFTRQIGSTAYNFLAHGPILLDMDALIVTPLSANHTFSIVTNKSFRVEVKKSVGLLEFDGFNIAKLNVGDSFTVTKSDKIVKIVKLNRGDKFSDKMAKLKRF